MKLKPCYKCGGRKVRKRAVLEIAGWTVQTHAHAEQCTKCGAEVISHVELGKAEVEAMTTVLLDLERPMPGNVLLRARKMTDFSVTKLGQMLGVDPLELERLEQSDEAVPRLIRRAMVAIVEEFGDDKPLQLAV